MPNKTKLLTLSGMLVAIIGLTTASIAFADSKVPSAPVAPTEVTSGASHSNDTDIETSDGATETNTDVETNDDATGPQEAPGIEHAD